MGVHDGHRARKRQQLLKSGPDSFADHEVLELLLYYAIPRRDTNPIAHRLLERFGSLDGVLSAPPEALMEVEGVGPGAAVLLCLVRDAENRSRRGREKPPVILRSVEEAGRFLMGQMEGEICEVMLQVCLDGKGKLLQLRKVAGGGPTSAEVNLRTITANAIYCGASGVILAHNHPSGLALPSREDMVATRQIQQVLGNLGIRLVDHIIVADGDFVSMAANGTLPGGY